jgi:hypothetical protein
MKWNPETESISGISETVPGDTYTLYFYMPEGYAFGTTSIHAENVKHKIHDSGLLEVSFKGQEEPVNWEIVFN